MRKPRPYKLEQDKTSDGFAQTQLSLRCCAEDGDRDIYLSADHSVHLPPRSARAMAERLLAMADWVERIMR